MFLSASSNIFGYPRDGWIDCVFGSVIISIAIQVLPGS